MFIEYLETQNFRNLSNLSLNLEPDILILEGDNAQGKTNILEALYVCATGRSFRNALPSQLLHHGKESGVIRARFVRQGVRHDIEVILGSKRRGMKVDGRVLRQASKLLELINVVAFFPEDLRIARGQPEQRRKFIDRVVANREPAFVTSASKYAKALKSRNVLLKQSKVPDPLLIETYDEQMIQFGAEIHRSRMETIDALNPDAIEHFQRLMKNDTSAAFELKSGLSDQGRVESADFAQFFREELRIQLPKDSIRGTTSVGPHRADLNIVISGQDARVFGSQGQQRALVLSLKIAEMVYLKRKLDCSPILLLDDVSSELDAIRTKELFNLVQEVSDQVWVTTTGAADLPIPATSKTFYVNAGKISKEPS